MPKTCLDSVVRAPSAYVERFGKQHSDLQHVQQGGCDGVLSVILIICLLNIIQN